MLDLFGNPIPQVKEQTPEDRYKVYLASAAWKKKRKEKLAEAHNRCGMCGRYGYETRLEVHHKTYDRLGKEKLSDLEVLCADCHHLADEERKRIEEWQRPGSALYTGFKNWIARGNTSLEVMNESERRRAKKEFLTRLYRGSGKAYSIDLRVLGYRDDDPKWTPER